jgi:hypothetical protein
MPTQDQLGNYVERFYKEVMNGKKGNLFTRVEWLENAIKHLQVGDITNFITNIINENKEIIQPSIQGGVSDPSDPTFSGIVISPLGYNIGGIIYSFAIVVDGVVVTGFGSDGGTPVVITGSGDMVGPSSAIDGNIPIFDGTTGKLIADSGIGFSRIDPAQNLNNVFVFDDFLGGNDADGGSLGSLGWFAATGTVSSSSSYILSWPTHPGVIRLDGASIRNAIVLSPDNSYNWILLANSFDFIQFVVNSNDKVSSNDMCLVGVANIELASGEIDTDTCGIYFRHAYGDTNWQAVTSDGVFNTVVDTGVLFVADTWFLFEIKRTAIDTFEFYINQSLVATISTNIPTDPISPFVGTKINGSDWYIFVDYFGMQLAPITQRWD